MKRFILILIFMIFMVSCNGQKKSISSNDKKMTIINNQEYIKWIIGKDFEIWKPEEVDLQKVDKVLINAIDNNEFYFLKSKNISEIRENYRQYLCYINEKGEKIVYINSMCELSIDYDKNNRPVPFDWKNEMNKISDGGSCYWNVKINLNTEKYYDLMINGQG